MIKLKLNIALTLALLMALVSCKDDDAVVPSDGFVDLLQPKITLITQEPTVGIEVFFSDTSFGEIVERHWDFGNGDTSDLKDSSTVFNEEGEYLVTLMVVDADGMSEEISISIVVGPLIIDGAYVLADEDYEFIADLGTDTQGNDMRSNLYFDVREDTSSFWTNSDIVNGINQLLLTKGPFETAVVPVMFRVFDGVGVRTTFLNFTLFESSYRQYVEYNTTNTDYLFMAQFGDETQEANMLNFLNFWRQRPSDPRYWFDNQMLKALDQLLLGKFDVVTGSIFNVEIAFYDGDQKRTTVLLIYNGENFELHPDAQFP